ncbi:Unknown protein [Striga hermonthica]|uniref:Uncharacterized protein n=1 Tax=Striga hermonthica TaxID=68872 RepID=A0A9N7NNI1_STRHE|nr:Unknown protein [Striga hermonthica]
MAVCIQSSDSAFLFCAAVTVPLTSVVLSLCWPDSRAKGASPDHSGRRAATLREDRTGGSTIDHAELWDVDLDFDMRKLVHWNQSSL